MDENQYSSAAYYPDRFYINLDGFDLQNLTDFLWDSNIGPSQATFIHEYFHYLTNITSFYGARQFHLNFCDRFRVVSNLLWLRGLDAFPIGKNEFEDCNHLITYWKNVINQIEEDNIDSELVSQIQTSANKNFDIKSVQKQTEDFLGGTKTKVVIHISGLIMRDQFFLTSGAIDEMFSSSIDEFLLENDLSGVNPSFLSSRPFYPYNFFDKLLRTYGINRASAQEKITLLYLALSSTNPAVALIDILENVKEDGFEKFQSHPEKYLHDLKSCFQRYDELLNAVLAFSNELENAGKYNLCQAVRYYYDKFLIARNFKEKDPLYFIRPFLVTSTDPESKQNRFLDALVRIFNVFNPPTILQNKVLYTFDKLTNFGESTALIIAVFEIFESLNTERIAKRPEYLKRKYLFPDQDSECDNPSTFLPPPIKGITFQIALNELSLFKPYLESTRTESTGT